jgi:hypothetical protein
VWLAAIGLCLLATLPATMLSAFPAVAQAEVEAIDFDSAPPPLNSPLELSAGGRIKFAKAEGFRPYRTDVGALRAHSGTTVGDLGRCTEEGEALGDEPEGCLSFQAKTTAVLTQTAKSVTLFAGRFGAVPEHAVLTALDAENRVVATTGPLTIGEMFRRTLSVESTAGDIARFRVEARTGPDGEQKGNAGDLGIDDVSVNFAEGGDPDFFVTTTNQVVALVQGQQTDVPVQVSRLNGSNGAIELSVTGLPAGVSAAAVQVPGGDSTATLRLTADPSAPDTRFVPTDVTLVARPSGPSVGRALRTAPLKVRVASEFALSAGGVSEDDRAKVLVATPDCAPVDVPVTISRDIAMNRDVSLGVREDGAGTGLPNGVSAEFLPSSEVPPGGVLVAERTLRFRAGASAEIGQRSLPILLEGRAGTDGPSHLLQMSMVHLRSASIETAPPRSERVLTPRFGGEGSVVRVSGLGFCPGTKVEVGNDRAIVPARMVDDRTLEFNVPRYATTGRVTIIPPGHLTRYKTENRLVVNSVRNVDGFAFRNYPFGSLSIDELTRAFGADDLFITVNPCWPWGNCRVVTGILDPLAALHWGWMNIGLRGSEGHCFGMGLAIQRLNSGKLSYRGIADSGRGNARSAFELSDREGPGDFLSSILDAEHALQFSDELLTARFERSKPLRDQLSVLEREFSRNRKPMIGLIKSTTQGHIVLAYDIVQDADSAEIYVYDSQQPFLDGEELDGGLHQASVDVSAIHVDKVGNTWSFPVPGSNDVWRGSGNDGSLWAIPHDTVPDDPSLPGVSALTTGLASLVFGSTDGSVRSQKGPAHAEFVPASMSSATPGTAGTWLTKDTEHPFEVTLVGTKRGEYTQAYTAPGFLATATDLATARGVRDTVTGGRDSVTVESGRARPLSLDLAQRSNAALTIAATLATQASERGSDTAGFAGDGALTYAHDGAPTTVEFTLTTVRRNGGPATFVSGPVAVAPGDRLRAKPLGRDLHRVKLEIRSRHGKQITRVLRDRGRPAGRLRLGAPRISGHRGSMRFKLAGFDGRAVAGAVLRLMRGTRVVARKAVSIKTANGTRKIVWRVPRGVGEGRYRLLADLRAITTGSRGSTVSESISAHRAARVRVGGSVEAD